LRAQARSPDDIVEQMPRAQFLVDRAADQRNVPMPRSRCSSSLDDNKAGLYRRDCFA